MNHSKQLLEQIEETTIINNVKFDKKTLLLLYLIDYNVKLLKSNRID